MSNNITKLLDWLGGMQPTADCGWFAAACEEIRAAHPPEPEKPKVEPYKWPFTVSELRSTGYASILDGTGYEICVVKGHRDEAARLNATIDEVRLQAYQEGVNDGSARGDEHLDDTCEADAEQRGYKRGVTDGNAKSAEFERRGYKQGYERGKADAVKAQPALKAILTEWLPTWVPSPPPEPEATPKVRGGE